MSNLLCTKLTLLGIAISQIAWVLVVSPADARRVYESNGTGSQSSASTQNPYTTNQSTPPIGTTSNTTEPYTSQQNQFDQFTPLQNQSPSPRNQYSPHQNQFVPPKNQYAQQRGTNSYPQQTQSNGTNYYNISPEQISAGAAVRDSTYTARDGVQRGGVDHRWDPNFGTGVGAQVMARESGGMAQALKDNFPLPMSGDEAQMFQVNDFAARSNGRMQNRPH